MHLLVERVEQRAQCAAGLPAAQAQRNATDGVARFGACLRYADVRMDRDPKAQPTPGSGQSPEGRLDSWKEIAAYLGRGIRTVQRWEREEGLPVHRLAHEKRGSIYARREELAAWWESRRLALAAPSIPEAVNAPVAPRLDRVTRTSAMTAWPTLSSDARLLAYVSDAGQDGMAPQIWIQQIGGAAMRLTNGEHEYSNLSFSPDDTRIIFTARDAAGQHVYEIPTLGGEPRLLKRAASIARFSPDGQWLAFVSLDSPGGIRIAARDGVGFRTLASELVDVSCALWLPDSRSLIVYAHPDPAFEPDWWVVAVDGRSPKNTGIFQKVREEGLIGLGMAAWVHDSLVFSAADASGVSLWRQRIVPSTLQMVGERARLTGGNEAAQFPTAAGGRLAFVSTRFDANLWSVAVDASGVAYGPLRRMTRGPGILGFLSVTRDGRTLAYFSVRLGGGDVFLRDVDTGSEKLLTGEPVDGKGYPAISPSGSQLAYGTRVPGARAMRPIFIACVPEGTSRRLGEDCGGRPRQWVDERVLVIERFARLNTIALIDTVTGVQRQLLESVERSVKNPRVSPDGRWIAFDAARAGASPSVLVARLGERSPIPESEWVVVDRLASHPFWSADGRLLYYVPTGANPVIRSVVRARHFDCASGLPEGEPMPVYAASEMAMPAFLAGTAPVATSDQIILVLGDFRGDVWLMELDPHPHKTAANSE
jgi:Tol biopolymer transport system component